MADLTQSQIEAWIKTQATGIFHYTKILDGAINPKLYPSLRTILHRCKEKGIAFPVTGKDGWWRPADNTLDELNWWDLESSDEDVISLPLGINKYCTISRPALIICAGTYNAGKSTFCLNTLTLNIPKWGGNLDYYVSEGADDLKKKFKLLGLPMQAPSFRTFRRTQNFADVIVPDNLSIVDYLRVDMNQTYSVGQDLFEIFNKLDKGVALVAMQKPKGERKLAFGGASTAFEPTLYVAMESTGMDTGWLGFEKIKKVKAYGGIDPYTLKIYYKMRGGAEFYNIEEKLV